MLYIYIYKSYIYIYNYFPPVQGNINDMSLQCFFSVLEGIGCNLHTRCFFETPKILSHPFETPGLWFEMILICSEALIISDDQRLQPKLVYCQRLSTTKGCWFLLYKSSCISEMS